MKIEHLPLFNLAAFYISGSAPVFEDKKTPDIFTGSVADLCCCKDNWNNDNNLLFCCFD